LHGYNPYSGKPRKLINSSIQTSANHMAWRLESKKARKLAGKEAGRLKGYDA
jgi:hypothetical protein